MIQNLQKSVKVPSQSKCQQQTLRFSALGEMKVKTSLYFERRKLNQNYSIKCNSSMTLIIKIISVHNISQRNRKNKMKKEPSSSKRIKKLKCVSFLPFGKIMISSPKQKTFCKEFKLDPKLIHGEAHNSKSNQKNIETFNQRKHSPTKLSVPGSVEESKSRCSSCNEPKSADIPANPSVSKIVKANDRIKSLSFQRNESFAELDDNSSGISLITLLNVLRSKDNSLPKNFGKSKFGKRIPPQSSTLLSPNSKLRLDNLNFEKFDKNLKYNSK